MKTYRNEHVTVFVDCGIHLIQQIWIDKPSSETFRNGSLAVMALARKHRPKRWLIDLQQLRLFNPTDIQWFINEWLPRATFYLPHNVRIAITVTDLNQFSKLGADLILRASGRMNEAQTSRYFVTNEEARQWLLIPD
ncbi:hypothetical protein [Spirosoma agri]|uniref:STAS/SEC14 domain-containing protein n=1 Tax=Spirosoma agri TaxID=1987381 RepID=A0A6M0IER3_9BACT|nr:hypothetical protein [Spirosoma agri]NEU66770.1 hypothetical protein [Spirosoma agri]